jgi:hypothetical protein
MGRPRALSAVSTRAIQRVAAAAFYLLNEAP